MKKSKVKNLDDDILENRMLKGDILVEWDPTDSKNDKRANVQIKCGNPNKNPECEEIFEKTQMGKTYSGNCPSCNRFSAGGNTRDKTYLRHTRFLESRYFTILPDEELPHMTYKIKCDECSHICVVKMCNFMRTDRRGNSNCEHCKKNGKSTKRVKPQIEDNQASETQIETKKCVSREEKKENKNEILECLTSNGFTFIKCNTASILARCDSNNHIMFFEKSEVINESILECTGCSLTNSSNDIIKTCTDNGVTLLSSYINEESFIEIECNTCSRVLYRRYSSVQKSVKAGKSVCNHKSKTAAIIEQERLDKFETFKKVLEEAGYTMLSDSDDYIGGETKCLVQCVNNHSPYETCFANFTGKNRPRRCDRCAKERMSMSFKLSLEKAIMYSKYANLELLNKEFKNMKQRCNFRCITCDHVFESTLDTIKNSNGSCPMCYGSAGELRTAAILKDWDNIKIIREKKFKDCRHIGLLKFDLYITYTNREDLKFIIEFDGKQHFEPVKHFGGDYTFSTTRLRDMKKMLYCEKNSIPIFRISYKDIDHIPEVFLYISSIIDKGDIPQFWYSNEEVYQDFVDEYECYKSDLGIY